MSDKELYKTQEVLKEIEQVDIPYFNSLNLLITQKAEGINMELIGLISKDKIIKNYLKKYGVVELINKLKSIGKKYKNLLQEGIYFEHFYFTKEEFKMKPKTTLTKDILFYEQEYSLDKVLTRLKAKNKIKKSMAINNSQYIFEETWGKDEE